MPPAPVTAEQLRERASTLRRLAGRLDATPALDLHRRAGHDTWVGATPTRCCDDLVALRSSLRSAGDDLRANARALDHRAAQLDAAP